MSFFRAIGYIMQGSGLKEVLSDIYAPKSLEKMLNGHAYARAVRAHVTSAHCSINIIKRTSYFDDVMDANLIITIENIRNKTLLIL